MPHSTLIDVFDQVARRPRPDLLLRKERGAWHPIATDEFVASVTTLAAFLIDFGVRAGDRVALLSENRPEWTIADFAIQLCGAINVPIFPSLSVEQTAHLLRHSGSTSVVVSRPDLIRKVTAAAEGLDPGPRILCFDEAQADKGGGAVAGRRAPGSRNERGGEVAYLREACEHGARRLSERPGIVEERMRAVAPGDLASIIYTSGTTGEPKGVMLTHGNFASNVDACLASIPFSAADTTLSILPLTHVLERTVEYCYLASGASIAYIESVEKAVSNIREARPTVFTTVPRVLEKLNGRVLDAVRSGPGLRRRLFEWALAAGRARMACDLAGRSVPLLAGLKWRIADRLVCSRIRELLGGRVRFLLSGGAPLSKEITEFFLAMGVTVLEGYGMTETSPVISVNTFDHFRPGTVGPPVPGVEVRIAKDGEILVRGPNVMKGYYRDPEATSEAVRDGFLATGDIGRIDEDGFLTITDRKKDILITSGGKNIAPQPIENAIKSSPFVANAIIFGDRKKFLAALIVPEYDAVRAFAASRGLGELLPAVLVTRPEVRSLIEREIAVATASFGAHEKVKRFTLLERDFSMDQEEVTPTLKIRRRIIADHFAAAIEAMYSG